MSDYKIQYISQRYIKNSVLEGYVNARVTEFGANWSYSKARGNQLTFTALRELTVGELDQLQEQSGESNPVFI
ncbi:hypothetical protein B5807_04948 [Epicoccum nigrum]|uniref:Uncharacterized protein n=1 Tax=Epicoccum nigrum TaxID=105696 RepID=A0A1Y2M3V3_EPING|nr:hypothetical protein B5807_04948 [Epicoccum nigrum]